MSFFIGITVTGRLSKETKSRFRLMHSSADDVYIYAFSNCKDTITNIANLIIDNYPAPDCHQGIVCKVYETKENSKILYENFVNMDAIELDVFYVCGIINLSPSTVKIPFTSLSANISKVLEPTALG